MKTLRGSSALSPLRRTQLLEQYHRLGILVEEIAAEYIYFVTENTPLSAAQQDRLRRLLYDGNPPTGSIPSGELLLVTPRPGMISPWCSKATDIAHNCDLTAIRRIERGIVYYLKTGALTDIQQQALIEPLYDPITETLFYDLPHAEELFIEDHPQERQLQKIPLLQEGVIALEKFNQAYSLGLEASEIDFLASSFIQLERDPYDIELYMFAQANSEHCRHKIFNANWMIDGVKMSQSLFSMIKQTYQQTPEQIISAYQDNAAILQGAPMQVFFPDPRNHDYGYCQQLTHLLIKVETHNHPTAFTPRSGAATGCGGEIRDEGATGCGATPKAGLVGFSVSNLRIPNFVQPWENEDYGKPDQVASALRIMLEAPLGAAAFSNEFGRPGLVGYFRTYEQWINTPRGPELRGYHKPIMLAGGIGHISAEQCHKRKIPPGSPLIVLGGPGLNIGLGGSIASSQEATEGESKASVQRENPEMQRRCQEVINSCCRLGGDANPILFIHDVGAGGLANAVPELIYQGHCGGQLQLRLIPIAESGMSPLEIWCNESQERYVLAVAADQLSLFASICQRERAPYAVIGEATSDGQLVLHDQQQGNRPIDLPVSLLLKDLPTKMQTVKRVAVIKQPIDTSQPIELCNALERVLRLPTVAEKSFLININDRSIGGLVTREPMVGPWQVPVANCGVTAASFQGYLGEAMAMGERSPVALLNPMASARLAVGEALTNLAATAIGSLQRVKLSANWMAAIGHPGEDAALFDAVRAIGEELCPALGLTIPVGKDSLSMKSVWQKDGEQHQVVAPLSLVVSAFAQVSDVRKTVTPQLRVDLGPTRLLLIDLGEGNQALGATALAQVYEQLGEQTADLRNATRMKAFFAAIQQLVHEQRLLAYHDRSDGGLITTLAEMAFAGHCGIEVDISALSGETLIILFNEELGAVIQIREQEVASIQQLLKEYGLADCCYDIGRAVPGDRFSIQREQQNLLEHSRHRLRMIWGETTWQLERLRDDALCVEQARQSKQRADDPGLQVHLTFDINEDIAAPLILTGVRPRLAVLREQGVNSHIEMAAAFDRAGFSAVDVHMQDILSGTEDLRDFQLVVACGGFSYGDVFGAGQGWAKSILLNPRSYEAFVNFFNRSETLTLGVCNGCQMLTTLREIIPGAQWWPRFVHNLSERFEARLCTVEVLSSPSLFLQGMEGSRLPIAIAHGEGRALINTPEQQQALHQQQLAALRYVDNWGQMTEHYPANPNGSPGGITGLTSSDGRVMVMMPHPERVFRAVSHPWYPEEWQEDGPWMRLFRNARLALG